MGNDNHDLDSLIAILKTAWDKVRTYDLIGKDILADPCTYQKMDVKSKKQVKIPFF